jgi:3-deoxy-D-manno-octulosonic-acid transferase
MKLGFIIYNLLLHLGTGIGFPIILYKLSTTAKYQISLKERFGFIPPNIRSDLESGDWVWLHAVSVGEVMAAVPIIKELKKTWPQLRILLSTVTVTGYQTAKEKVPWADQFIFFPFDYPWSVKKVIDFVRPKVYLAMETELWPNFFHYLAQKGIPSAIINGRLSPKSYKGYRRVRFFMTQVLSQIDLFGMQTEADAKRIEQLGVASERIKVLGNVKFDQATSLAAITEKELDALRQSFGLNGQDQVIIAGSTHRGEEEIIVEIYEKLRTSYPSLLLIIAPRHIERAEEIEELIDKKGLSSIRRTRLIAEKSESRKDRKSIIILDTLGELASVYALGIIVFVGGSLVPTGGQNLLEPAVHKKPVFFGPSVFNFEEISRMLKESGGGIQIMDGEELTNKMLALLEEPQKIEELGKKAQQVVFAHQGAVSRHIELIDALLNKKG